MWLNPHAPKEIAAPRLAVWDDPWLPQLLNPACWLLESVLVGLDQHHARNLVEQAEPTLGKPSFGWNWQHGKGTELSERLLPSQGELERIRNLIPLIWLEALQQAFNFHSPAGQDFL